MPYDEVRASSYDRIHQSHHPAAAVEALIGLHRRVEREEGRPGRVLELGIGTGRLALPLTARGVEVWGIDDSEPMVARLREKPGGAGLRVVMGDFSRVGELVDGPFSLVFVAYNTLFELPDQDAQVQCVQGAAARLSPRGLFVVEALAPDATRLDQSLSVSDLRPDQVVLQATHHDPATQRVKGADVVLTPEGARLSPWTIRYASVAELDLMARLAGLRLVERWGDWNGRPFTASTPTHVSVYGPAADGSAR